MVSQTSHNSNCTDPHRFVMSRRKISIQGSEVIPLPLFNVLDGKNTSDYVARVEPSSQGGRKMAEFLLDTMDRGSAHFSSLPVEAQHMVGR